MKGWIIAALVVVLFAIAYVVYKSKKGAVSTGGASQSPAGGTSQAPAGGTSQSPAGGTSQPPLAIIYITGFTLIPNGAILVTGTPSTVISDPNVLVGRSVQITTRTLGTTTTTIKYGYSAMSGEVSFQTQAGGFKVPKVPATYTPGDYAIVH